MDDPAKRIKKIQEKINDYRAQAIAAEKVKQEVIEELKKVDIDIKDLDEVIKQRIEQKEKLEKELLEHLEEAENVIKGI